MWCLHVSQELTAWNKGIPEELPIQQQFLERLQCGTCTLGADSLEQRHT